MTLSPTQQPTGGRPTGGKPINLGQLETELNTAGINTPTGIAQWGDFIYLVNPAGQLRDFPPPQRPMADDVIAAHVAERDKTAADFQSEYTNPTTTLDRKVDIQAQLLGLLPNEQTTTPAPVPPPPLMGMTDAVRQQQ